MTDSWDPVFGFTFYDSVTGEIFYTTLLIDEDGNIIGVKEEEDDVSGT